MTLSSNKRSVRGTILSQIANSKDETKYDLELNAVCSAHDLILGIFNEFMFLNQTDFYYMCGSLCKNLAQFCKKDGIPLKTRISGS